jgi:peptidoglycan/LPS O-acetylase OafA/YrhL
VDRLTSSVAGCSAARASTLADVSRRTIAYQPALDGTRALAVSAVLLFHGGVGWMSGGYLGVSVFFTLSGFLITSLLLAEHEHHGRIDVAAFYTRRARRLLPASMVCLVAVSAMAWAGWFEGVANLRRDVLGALFQVFNWVKLGAGESYADLFAATAGLQRPLDHYWSLAIEEQFYWVWPLTFMGLLWLSRRFRVRPLVSVGVLTALSAVAAPIIAHVWSADAAYWATPARICEILAGALVACWSSGRDVSPKMARLAPASLVLLAAGCVFFPKGSGPAYEGALPLVALCSAALIVGLQAEGPVRQLLSVTPLVGLGKISYGVYLYHWPVFVLVDRQGWDVPAGVELTIKCAIAVTAAVVSYFLIERPIRTANWLPPRRTLVAALGGTAVAGVLAWLIIPTESTYYGVDKVAAEQAAFDTGPVDALVPLPPTVASSPAPATTAPGSTAAPVTSLPVVTTATELPVPSRPVRVVVVGDSTAEAMGAGLVAWAAANPQYAQVELVTGLGCGLVTRGYLDIPTGRVDVAQGCGPYVNEYVPERVAELRPDVVMVMSTVWDVLDRSLTPDGPFLTPLDSEIRELITDSFASFTDMLLGLGVPRVVWIQAPPPLPAAFGGEDQQADPARHKVMHTVIAQICAQRPATRVVDLAGWLVEQGLATSSDARRDGTHFTSEAALGIATRFLGPALVQAAVS